MTRRRFGLVTLLVVAAAAVAMGAYAAWQSTGSGTASASAASGLVGAQPSGTVAGGDDVTVSWAASAFPDGTSATGYTVKRYSSPGDAAQTVLSNCAGTITATTCTENNVPSGAWQYTVTPQYLTWSGTESAKSAVVTVATAPLDSTPPTLGVTFPASGGTYRTSTWNAGCTSTICGTASDAGSGLASVGVSIRQGTGNYWSALTSSFSSPVEILNPASGTATWSLAFPAAGFPADGTYSVRIVATDVATNTTSATRTIVYDATAPANALSLTTLTGGSFLNGNTLYFKGNAVGNLTLTDTVTDSVSGPASATFPALSTSGWTHSAVTRSTPTGGPYVSNTFTWTMVGGMPAGYAVTGADTAGNTTATGVTFTNDITAPVDGSLSYANGFSSSASVAITLANGTDAASGVNPAATQLQRASAALTNGTCALLGTFATIATAPALSYTDTTVASGNCYQYRYLVADRVGNQATFTSSNVTRIDTANPTVAFTFPSTSGRYNASRWDAGCSTPTGDFCGTASDPSGVSSVRMTVQRGDGLYWNGTTWASGSTLLTPTSGTTSWFRNLPTSALNDGATYTLTTTATDTFGTTGSASSTFTYDTTAPTAVDVQTTGAGAAFRIDSGDVITLTFSEVMDPDAILDTWDGSATSINNLVQVTNGNGGANDTIRFGGSVQLGVIDLANTAWVTSTNNLDATLSMATVNGRSVVTIRILEDSSSAQVPTAGALKWTPDTDALDLAGNAASNAQVTESGASDGDF